MTDNLSNNLKPIIIHDDTNRFLIQYINKQEIYEIKKTNVIYIPSIRKINTNSKSFLNLKKENRSFEIYGIIGEFTTNYTDYLILISEAEFIGEILKSKIYKIKKFLFLPFEILSRDHQCADQIQLDMQNDFLLKNNLFFSENYDLTNNIHDNILNKSYGLNSNILNFNYLKHEFCWNYNQINPSKLIINHIKNKTDEELLQNENKENKDIFITPIINGYVEIKKIEEYERDFIYILLARKDNRRTGMRFIYRGADEEGNCANFVETEQIMFIYNKNQSNVEDNPQQYEIVSHLQVRGSIPIKWTQPSNFKRIPRILLNENYEENKIIMKKHLVDINKKYNSVIMVNLIDKQNDQLILGDLFNNLYNSLVYEFPESQKPEFIWFDFHDKCKKMKYENLSILLNSEIFKKFLFDKEYFHLIIPDFYDEMEKFTQKNFKQKIKIISTQKGVFRTNCIDCLDRTNIVQTLISRHITQQIIIKLNICSNKTYTGKVFDPFRKKFEGEFRNFWFNHGDSLSLAYSGTEAQKSDFTRLGKRTILGAIKDFFIAARRFYINNVYDFYNQDCQDLFLDRIIPKNRSLAKKPKNTIFYPVYIIAISYFVYWLSYLFRNRNSRNSTN